MDMQEEMGEDADEGFPLLMHLFFTDYPELLF